MYNVKSFRSKLLYMKFTTTKLLNLFNYCLLTILLGLIDRDFGEIIFQLVEFVKYYYW